MGPAVNPLLHSYPGHAMPPAQMHQEINSGLHADCTLHTCDMLRACWTQLIDMGHLHPNDSPDDCPMCAEQRAAQSDPCQ
ncbi:hypothetical protein [Nocardia transvalensis]|uniref:hypothetical protein n=1 Tax=Nocardia transvalensis TaxID=37333 RepID=UPI0018943A0A|nr:hypothetical protein [Nocardia transvalensis]MBF6333879.1 hypothetical protein [Nocardia transvalensis]